MKRLYLIRHAKSSWKDASLADIDRPLNKRGKRDAPFMGKLLAEKGIQADVLISSPANRAFTTARAFASALHYPIKSIILDEAIYEAGSMDLLRIVQGLDNNWFEAMLFGHNMTYTIFANWYAQPPLENVPTCGIVTLQFDVDDWSQVTVNNGSLVFFEYPRKYFPKKST